MTHEMEFKPMQLLRVPKIDGCYTINRVTEKAIMVETDDGRWGGHGFIPLWIPKSIISYQKYDGRPECSQFGTHVVALPEWFINKNAKKL